MRDNGWLTPDPNAPSSILYGRRDDGVIDIIMDNFKTTIDTIANAIGQIPYGDNHSLPIPNYILLHVTGTRQAGNLPDDFDAAMEQLFKKEKKND